MGSRSEVAGKDGSTGQEKMAELQRERVEDGGGREIMIDL